MDDTTWFWEIVDARGLANVGSCEFVALNELIGQAERAEAELNAVSAAIGSPRFMDPPDGGDVPVAEQVKRMRNALELAEASAAGAQSMLVTVQQECIEARAIIAACQSVMAMMTAPEAIKRTTVINAYAAAVAAEVKARNYLSRALSPTPAPKED